MFFEMNYHFFSFILLCNFNFINYKSNTLRQFQEVILLVTRSIFALFLNTHSFVNVNILSVKHSLKMLLIFCQDLGHAFLCNLAKYLICFISYSLFLISQILFRKICHKCIHNLRNMLFSIPESLA